MMGTVLLVLLILFTLLVGAMVAYLGLLTVCAWLHRERGQIAGVYKGPREALHKFILLIPAHNEELLLGNTLKNLAQMDYPASHYQVVVLADNCTDKTTEIARSNRATVLERHDPQNRGKGQALHWAMINHLRKWPEAYDAVVVVDADSNVNRDFLWFLNAKVGQGHQVMQAYYGVQNEEENWRTSIMVASLAAFHFLRPLGRDSLGLSSGLKGNGMCFSSRWVRTYGFPASSVTEDIELGLFALRQGIKVKFVPGAHVLGQMARSSEDASTQRARWEGGRLELLRSFALPMLVEGVRERRMEKVDAALDLFVPPLTLLVLLSIVGLFMAAGALLFAPGPFTATFALFWCAWVLLEACYVFSGLALIRAPRSAYLCLMFVPIFVVWKVGLYAGMFFGANKGTPTDWVRTGRHVPGIVAEGEEEQGGRDVSMVVGLPVDNLTLDEAVARILGMIADYKKDRRHHQVATVNVDFTVNALGWRINQVRHPELMRILRQADLVTADGMPIVWASRLKGAPLKERVTGADMVPKLAEASNRQPMSFYLMGARPEIAQRAAEILKRNYPNLRIAGLKSPSVSIEGEDLIKAEETDLPIVEEINASNPDVLLVALGNPKQEIWISRNRDRLKVPVSIGVGGTFAFIAGEKTRPPKWLQDAGLEWVHRLMEDPTRLWKRYLIGFFKFGSIASRAIFYYWYRSFLFKRFSKSRAKREIRTYPLPASTAPLINTIMLPGFLESDNLVELGKIIEEVFAKTEPIALDFQQVSYVDSYGLAYILALWRRAEKAGKRLYVIGINPANRRFLELTRTWDLFREIVCKDHNELLTRLERDGRLPRFFYFLGYEGEHALISFFGVLDALQRSDIDLGTLIQEIGGRHCIVNLQGLNFMDSSGLAFFMIFQRQLSNPGQTCVICGLSTKIEQLFRITRAQRLFHLSKDVESAKRFLKKPHPLPNQQ